MIALQRSVGNRAARGVIQRQAACPRDYESGEVQQSREAAGILNTNIDFSSSRSVLIVQDFGIGHSTIPQAVTNSMVWQRVMSTIAGDPSIVASVGGFTDCVGRSGENFSLREARRLAILNAMPAAARGKVTFSFTSSTTSFITTNDTRANRARNRSVRITFRSVPRSGTQPCDQLTRASNLDEWLFLVRCLEQRLGLTRASQRQTALSVLRQIYYGTGAWSRSRNRIWGSVLPSTAWAPGTDPTPRLGPALFGALAGSQVVNGVDVGHMLTGVEAMTNPHQVVARMGPIGLQTSLRNEDWATWAGDVGSAAVKWAVDAHYAGRRGSLDRFYRNFASSADMEGNLAAFALRRGSNVGQRPSALIGQRIRLSGTLSEALLQFFRISGTPAGRARASRHRDFVATFGGVVSGGRITNRPALFAQLQPPVGEFASLLVIQEMLRRGGQTPPAGAEALSPLLAAAIDEMTNRLIDWLGRRV